MERLEPSEKISRLDWAVLNLVINAYEIINTKFGPEGYSPMPYHGPEHTHLVVRSASQLALESNKRGKITAREIQLLRVAAAYHDIDYESYIKNFSPIAKKKLIGGEDPFIDNERQSAERAATEMSLWNMFSDQEIDRVRSIILATRLKVASPEVGVVQYPDKNDYLTMLMVDADTSSLGAPVEVYWDMAKRFFAEDQTGVKFSGNAFYDFVERQKGVVGNHRFQTAEARKLFNHKEEILEFLNTVKPKRVSAANFIK